VFPKELTKALKAAGVPPLSAVKHYAAATQASPRSTGALAASYKLGTSGASAFLRSRVPYAAGAEWGTKGKWAGFRKYPGTEADGRGRFAWRAVYEQRDAIAAIITKNLEDLIEVHGWARP